MRFLKISLITILFSLLAHQMSGRSAAATPTVNHDHFLPWLKSSAAPAPPVPTINAPYFADLMNGDGTINRFGEMALTWFGEISPSENYLDIRAAYDADELVIYAAVIDRLIWYDTSPAAADLTQWDSLVLYLDRTANGTAQPTTTAYRFEVQYSGGSSPNYQAAYRGNGTGWQATNLSFSHFTASRWEQPGGPNSGGDSRGWVATIRIPFASLGVAQPASGTTWQIAVTNQDRDNAAGTGRISKSWPTNATNTASNSWGHWHFGLPTYTPPGSTPGGTAIIRHNLNGATVRDANVGGYTVCGGGFDYWSEWGNATWGDYNSELSNFNIQNQSDIADWPCFARYYITFPITAVPTNKVIRSATLTLHQIGNSEPAAAEPSLIQVLTIGEDWQQATATWNNTPQPMANHRGTWIDPLPGFPGWPGVLRTLDVSLAVAEAYAAGEPVRLALYEADDAYHSGKYFVGSGTGEWNAVGRPTLTIVWGNP
ncbi:MAG: DNRLRE domain-containing protein [Chloroflexi bacterium]|nr:DNRLRE domain-containing protein [Chloroflexota bacterium]MBP8059270.1 DNRLRE domain-containing protein [Chloroflexota bacterium]